MIKGMTVKEIKYLVLALLFIGITVNLTKTTWDMLKSKDRLLSLDREVAQLRDKKTGIEDSIEYKKTDGFVEDFARNELNLIKPGEDVVVVSTHTIDLPENTAIAKNSVVPLEIKPINSWIRMLF
jgi:cell division protein FtsB